MTNHYDTIIIGAGHNGLVAAAYLAKQGKKVLVLERRSIVGGSVVTESFGENFTVDSVQTGGALRPDIIKDLKLSLPTVTEKPDFISLQPDGNHLILNEESIKRFSEKDASRWNEFVRFMDKAASILDAAYATIMPRLPKNMSLRDGYGLLELGLELRLAGRKDMLNFIRALPMSAQELMEEYFESEIVKAAIASVAIHGSTLGPMSAGSGYTLIHNWLNRGGLSLTPTPLPLGEGQRVRGIGEITNALANAVKSFGGAANSMSHSWCGIPSAGATLGATVNSTNSVSGNFCIVNFIAFSTSSPITCSPKAEIKCLILPLTIMR